MTTNMRQLYRNNLLTVSAMRKNLEQPPCKTLCFSNYVFVLLGLFLYFAPTDASQSHQIIQEMAKSADVNINGTRPWDIKVYENGFYDRVLRDQSLGLGESYVENWWDAEALDECLYRIIQKN